MTLESLLKLQEQQIQTVSNLRSKGYERRQSPAFQKSILRRAIQDLDKTNIAIEKIEYNQEAVIKLIRMFGLQASRKQTTAIRGFNTYTKGYEVDNKYSVSYISLHHVSESETIAIKKLFIERSINASIDRQGISLKKS